MQVIVIHLEYWRRGGEPAALARMRLLSAPMASVMAVGEGSLPSDLLSACTGRAIVHVDAPLHALEGRRLPDVRHSGDTPQLGWSLAVMAALSTLHARHGLDWAELPTLGALAYASLQERATTGAFEGVRWLLRFDGLSAIEAVRQGRNVEITALMAMDMERMCLEQCDQLLVDSAGIGMSLQEFLAGTWRSLPMQMPQALPMESLTASGKVRALACVCSEGPTLRQCLRALSGYLQEQPDDSSEVAMVCDSGLLEDGIQIVPPALRSRFILASIDALRERPMRIVMPDRWSAGAALAREFLACGHTLIADAANMAFDSDQGWQHDRTLLCYDNASSLLDVLRTSEHWLPTGRINVDFLPAPQMPETRPVGPATVSVVVPCFNMGRWLPHTLRSIQRFSWADLDVIVVDDGSTDPDTRQLMAQLQTQPLAGLRVIRLAFNQGLSAARNAGVAAARGEFTLCLDADDLLSPEFVAMAVQALQRFPGHDFVVPRGAYFADESDSVDIADLKLGQVLPLVGSAFDSGMFGNRFSTATCLARTSVLRALGYDESLRAYEDWQLYRRALQQGSRFLVSNDIHFFYRKRRDSMIHAPAMRALHSRLYAEMMSGSALCGQAPAASTALFGALAAPPNVDGDSSGLLLSGVNEALNEMEALRRSRIVGLAYRLSAMLRRVRY